MRVFAKYERPGLVWLALAGWVLFFSLSARGDLTNTAPSFTKGTNVVVAEDTGLVQIANWVSGIKAGLEAESGQLLSFIVTNSNNGLFSAQPELSTNRTLSFTPATNIIKMG